MDEDVLYLGGVVLDPSKILRLELAPIEDINRHFFKLFPESGKFYRDIPVSIISKKEFLELRHKDIMEIWESIINEDSKDYK